MRRIRRPDRWYLAGALVILLAVSILSYQDWSVFQRSAPQVQHGRALLQQIELVLSSVKDAESGQRGFVLTGDPEYLGTYNAAVASLPFQLSELRKSVADEPALRTRVATLDGLISETLAELKETVAVRQNEGFQAALSMVQTNRGKQAMDEIRNVGEDLQNEVYGGLLKGIRERQQQGSRTRLTTATGAAVLFAFLLLAIFDIGRATAERDRLIRELALANDRTTISRDLMHTTLTSIAEGVIATDKAGKVTFLNGVAEKLTGWTQSEAQGQQLQDILTLVVEETRQPLEDPVARALRDGVVTGLSTQTVLISRDGSERPIDDSVAPIRGAEGAVIGVVLVFRDTSRRRQAEDELRRLNTALMRTNQDLQQFSYAASHDLKEPLRTVSNYLQLIRSRYSGKLLDEQAAQLFDVAVAGAQRMYALVEALLEYSRAGEVGQSTMEPVPVRRVVNDAVANLQSAILEAGAEISVGPLPVLIANPLHLRQVFENLIGNALKYRSKQPPRVSVTAAEGPRDWIFTVADNGIGIPVEYQTQIFSIFRRLHGDEYPGTGIGLATCKKIVDRHGGTIWVDSEPGKGSQFSFTVPRTVNDISSVEAARPEMAHNSAER